MSLKEDIENDLEEKLKDDIRRAMLHYAEMCKLAELDNVNAWASIMSILSILASALVGLGRNAGMPREVLLQALSEQWDRTEKRERRER